MLGIVGLALLVGCGADESSQPAPLPLGSPEPLKVMTFNVLCSFCGGDEPYDGWDERLAAFDDIFVRHDPDLIGLQELALASEVDQLLALRPGFAAVFYRNEDNAFAYPDATVFYRRERFVLVSNGHYWLSPTPEVPSSTGFADPQLPRLVTWTELRDRRNNRPLYFASTHVDNNTPSQEESAPLILERTTPWLERMPALVVGDFNSKPDSAAYQILTTGSGAFGPLHNSQALADDWRVEHNQPSEPSYALDQRIDHIFVSSEAWQVRQWVVDLYQYGDQVRYPSDHRAMVAELTPPSLP
jgi:endonuclease/exonuclease/phosphatase family metal-dependent hydrolase